MIAAHPWVGWGLGCWPAVYPAFATFDPGVIVNQAHSDWLQWTAEGGLPVGLAMLSSRSLGIYRPAIRSIWGIGVFAVLIHAAFDYPFSRPAIGAWPILILSMAAVTRQAKNLSTAEQCYSGLTVDDLPPPRPKATPTTAPAAMPTMTRIFAVSLCTGRGAEERGCWLRRGGSFWIGADLRPRTIGRNGVAGRCWRTCRGSACRSAGAAPEFSPRISLSGIW